jgi:type IV pilus assembly protein PilA
LDYKDIRFAHLNWAKLIFLSLSKLMRRGGDMKTLGNKGFTLVELMVVVAIIGILSAVAIPNFKKYQGKSKQGEAKILLAGAFTAEESAYAEYDEYFGCLTAMGFEIGSPGYYMIGFGADPGKTTGLNGQPANCLEGANESFFTAAKGTGGVVAAAQGNLDLGTNATAAAAETFQIGAAGSIMTGNDCDVWRIDEQKQLEAAQSGLNDAQSAPCT